MAHKYYDDLFKGKKYKPDYPTEICGKGDKREKKWKKEREKYGFDNRETWNLNTNFYVWLYERLKMYKKHASKIVDLTFYKFEYDGETLTQIECIDRMIEGCKLYIEDDENPDKEVQKKIEDVAKIWAMVLPHMWW